MNTTTDPGYVKDSYVVTFPGGTNGTSLLEKVAAGKYYDTTTNKSIAPDLKGGGTLRVTWADEASHATAQRYTITSISKKGETITLKSGLSESVRFAPLDADKVLAISTLLDGMTVILWQP